MRFCLEPHSNGVPSDEQLQIIHLCESKKFNPAGIHTWRISDSPWIDEIPVGSLEYVEAWLKEWHGINGIPVIEVPEVLRKPEFLLRKYEILPKDKLERDERLFFKYAEKQKRGFCGTGVLSEIEKYANLDNGVYVRSEIIDVHNEYRVFVMDDEILAVQPYGGNPMVSFCPLAIEKMVLAYMKDDTRPRAYTMDVAICSKGTAILEIHPFVSCGTYGFYSSDLLKMYKWGIEYCVKYGDRVE